MVLGSVAALATCDGKAMCKAAERLPKPKAVQTTGAIDESKLNYEMLQHIVGKLWKYPKFTKTIHSVLFSEQFTVSREDEAIDRAWELPRVKSLKLLPRNWMASYLLGAYAKHGLQPGALNSLEQHDSELIPMLFSMDQQMPLGSQLPKEMHGDPVLAGRIFDKRSDKMGRRLKYLIKEGGITTKSVLLHKGGCFKLQFGEKNDSAIVTEVIHVPTNMSAEVPAHTPITKAFEFENNFLDSEARVVLHPSRYNLVDFFPADSDLKKQAEAKKALVFKDLLAEAACEDEKQDETVQKAREVANVSRSALVAAAQAKQRARTDKARTAIEAKKNERAKKRRITLSGVGETS